MKFADALRVTRHSKISIVGAGGKTTALFLLGKQIAPPVIITSSTHLSIEQVDSCPNHVVLPDDNNNNNFLDNLISTSGPTLITSGEIRDDKVLGLSFSQLTKLKEYAEKRSIPMIIEADGSRRKPLKAPDFHEPAIPHWSTDVIVMAGMSAVGKPCNEDFVHRPQIFCELAGLKVGDLISAEHIGKFMEHKEGGLKNIPPSARKIVILNQCDDLFHQTNAACILKHIKNFFDVILTASLNSSYQQISAREEPTACVILAAGDSARFGAPKAMAIYRDMPFVCRSVKIAKEAGFREISVVTGNDHSTIEKIVATSDVKVVFNPNWRNGQGTSVSAGISSLTGYFGNVIFLLVDQPHISPLLLKALREKSATSNSQVIIPCFQEQRGNPVLFDQSTFHELALLNGKEGGRAVMKSFSQERINWLSDEPVLDVDTPGDLVNLENYY